jgi:hypothetical protein
MRNCLLPIAFAVLCNGPASALDLPARRPGLWELKLTLESLAAAKLPPVIAEHCIDAETDKLMNITGGSMRPDTCSKPDVQKVGSTVVVDSVCQLAPGLTMRSHAVIAGDFSSAYTVKLTSKQEGPEGKPISGIPANEAMTIEAKRLGQCKPDQRPGDMIMAGRKTNVRDVQNPPGMPGATRPGAPAQKK